jgi:hypothetical protein
MQIIFTSLQAALVQGVWFDQTIPWTPDAHTIKQLDREDKTKRRPALCCAQCQHRITEYSARMNLAGGHVHVFTNPGGYTYEIGLYEFADCIARGPATTEYTWFPGHTWQLALCANCHEHLGWRYRKVGSTTFYGLIRDRLIEVDE